MQVMQTKMLDLLGAPEQKLVVPIYQRVYSWTRPQLREFWDDMIAAGKADSQHFMGTVFYTKEEMSSEDMPVLDIIDGQQRLTTLTLLMCALRDHLKETGETLNGLNAEGVSETFLQSRASSGIGCKLVLSRADAPTLGWVVGICGKPQTDEEYSKLVTESCHWFKDRIANSGLDFKVIEHGLNQLSVITIEMEAKDRPQTVFESLNSKGLALSTPDLVRNYLLMRDEFDSASYLYDTYWAGVENAFAADDDDHYLAHAIRMWTGGGAAIKSDRDIFDAFKSSFAVKDAAELEKRTAGLASFCLDFHEKVANEDEATLKACKEWDENRGRAERLSNNRKIFGD